MPRVMFGTCSWRRFASTGTKGRLVDKVRIYARGGGGGQGFPKLGGAGADGSNVLVKAKHDSSLGDIARRATRRFIGITGTNSTRTRLTAKKGKDVVISVPPGTVVFGEDGEQLCDLNVAGEEYLLARGGAGGDHTNNFLGRRGEACVATLLLKTIADIGMVGFPNAGKSTLLRALSRASPEVADYPFTTLRPHLGVVEYNRSGDQLSVADLPGLVEGAHDNVGMGHKFLRHIERTKVLLFVVDVHGFQLSRNHPHRDAVETVKLLLEELELYQEGLSNRRAVLVANKMDLFGAQEKLASMLLAVEQMGKFSAILPTAAQVDEGIEPVVTALANALKN